MSKRIASFDREFKIWRYVAGHGQLLLRSPKAEGKPTRMDVLFKDVRALELRTTFPSLIIEEVEPSEVVNRPAKPTQTIEPGLRVFLLKSKDWVGYIVAGSVHWHEDEAEYGQPSALFSEAGPI